MIEKKTCAGCNRCLPVSRFNIRRDRMSRQRDLMRRPPQSARVWKSDSVRENNAFNLWHGPVSREPLRWRA